MIEVLVYLIVASIWGVMLWVLVGQRRASRDQGDAIRMLQHQGFDLVSGLERTHSATLELARAQTQRLAATGQEVAGQVAGQLEALTAEILPIESGQRAVSQGVDRVAFGLGRLADGVVSLKEQVEAQRTQLEARMVTQTAAFQGWLDSERDRNEVRDKRQAEVVERLVEPVVTEQRAVVVGVDRLVAGVAELETKIRAVAEAHGLALADVKAAVDARPSPPPPQSLKLTLPQGLIEAAAKRGVNEIQLREMAGRAFKEMVTTE